MPFLSQIQTPLYLPCCTKDTNQDIDSGNASTDITMLHLVNDLIDYIKWNWSGFGKDGEDAIVGERIVPKSGDGGGREMEEVEGLLRIPKGLEDLRDFRGG